MTKLQGHWGLGTGAGVSVCTKIKSWQLLPGMHKNLHVKNLHVKNLHVKNLHVKNLHVKVKVFYM